MRVLTVSHFFSTHGGGIEIVAGQLCSQWKGMGHMPNWAASDADRPPIADGIQVTPLRSFNFVERVTGLPMPVLSLGAMRLLWRSVRESDLVVIHDSLYVTSILAMVAAKREKKPTILIQHTAETAFANGFLRLLMKCATALITKPMLAAAGHVVFISATTSEFYAGVPTKSTPQLAFNGVDHEIFNFSRTQDVPLLRKRFGLPEDGKLCVFVGRFVKNKGLEILRELARSRPDLHFALAGRGPIDPGSWNLSNVTVCGHLPQSGLAMLYHAADVFLLASEREGYPLVIQEAMACGLPVVCGDETAKADPDASQWLSRVAVSLSDPENSARRVSAAIDRSKLSAEDRAAMSGYAARAYSWPGAAEKIIRLAGQPR